MLCRGQDIDADMPLLVAPPIFKSARDPLVNIA